ncbi:hypothetical protein XENTR_v10020331 [Xenopus tropicalis]|nr:hypothetical protein XENTR_v10020331 [Xenopus tropicalis]
MLADQFLFTRFTVSGFRYYATVLVKYCSWLFNALYLVYFSVSDNVIMSQWHFLGTISLCINWSPCLAHQPDSCKLSQNSILYIRV